MRMLIRVQRLITANRKTQLLLLLLLFKSVEVYASPIINDVNHTANTLTIYGSSFSSKPNSLPFYYSNFDSELTGQMPTNQVSNLLSGNQGTVQSNVYRSGTKSLEFDYCADAGYINWSSTFVFKVGQIAKYNNAEYTVIKAVGPSTLTPDIDVTHFQVGRPVPHCKNSKFQGNWIRNAIDFGAGGANKIFMSMWLYLDKGTSTCNSWQWKNFIATSNSNLYIGLTAAESVVFFEPWYFNNSQWGNSGSPHIYYWEFTQSKSILSSTTSAPTDMFLWGQWQRIDLYLQRSSDGAVPDGVVYFNRIGRTPVMINKTNVITHANGDDPWRYLDLSNAVESVYEGYVDFKVYMEDVYVDSSQARVDICDSSTWEQRTRCEIQRATTWGDGQITVNFNQGNFSPGQIAYIYVIDGNGNVSNGFKYKIGAPLPPKEFIKAP